METVKVLTSEVKNDTSGTTQMPFIAASIPGKCGTGTPLIVKIENDYYEANIYNKAKKWTLYRCKQGNNVKRGSTKCPWTCRVKKVPLPDAEDFNFEIVEHPKAKAHTCESINEVEIEGGNRYRAWIRKDIEQGSRNYDDIKKRSNIRIDYRTQIPDLIGDDINYKRMLYDMMRGNGTSLDVNNSEEITISEHLKQFIVKSWVQREDGKYYEEVSTEQFYQGHIDGIIYFYRKSNLHLLSHRMAVDGTYEAIKNLKTQFKQLYVVATQLISDDNKTTVCVPVVCALFPNKKKESYVKFFTHLDEVTVQVTGSNLRPKHLTMDNELGAMLAAKHVLQVQPLTCVFHIYQATGRYLTNVGFAMNSNPPYFVRELHTNVMGLFKFNMNDEFTYQLAMNYLASQSSQAHLTLEPNQAENVDRFIEYLQSNWFNVNSPHFVGVWSNYWLAITSGNSVLTNNANEALNASLKHYLPKGIINSKVLRDFDKVCETSTKFARFRQSLRDFANICEISQTFARFRKHLRDFDKVLRDFDKVLRDFDKLCRTLSYFPVIKTLSL